MPKLEANLQWMFTEYEILDRYEQLQPDLRA
jgi:hypothetical protein